MSQKVVLIAAVLIASFKVVRSEGCITGEARLVDRDGNEGQSGIVQLCTDGIWSTVCRWNDWNTHAANVVCRQLGYLEYGAVTLLYSCSTQCTGTTTFINVRCQGTERQLEKCTKMQNNHECYYPYPVNRYGYSNVTCFKANCIDGEIRLVDGLTNREGRLEVCFNGRWGTICGENWTEEEASIVCGRLGFSREGVTKVQFGQGTGPTYNCNTGARNCKPVETTSTCTHSKDAGVRCLGFDEAMSASSNSGLQAVTGLSIIALIAVVAGWIATCVYMWRKNNSVHAKPADRNSSSHQQRPLDNPVYDGSTGPAHLQTNYSSVGPAYEPVNANRGTGYDVINRGGAPRPHPPVMSTGAHNPALDQGYSVLDHHGDKHDYHVLESGGTDNQEQLVQRGAVENEYETTGPQDYEIPT